MSFEQAVVLARVEVRSSGMPPVAWLSSFLEGEILYGGLVLCRSCREDDSDLLILILQPNVEHYFQAAVLQCSGVSR